MAQYAWYTRATDAVHRLTVLGLVGGTFYMLGAITYQMYIGGQNFEREKNLQAAAVAGASAGPNGEKK